jgi:hypothetical protein
MNSNRLEIVTPQVLAAACRDAEHMRLSVRTVWIGSTSGEQELIQAIGRALQFPSYCGKNWNAFEECIRDLDDDVPGWLLILEGTGRLKAVRADLEMLATILADTKAFWEKQHRTFSYVFSD